MLRFPVKKIRKQFKLLLLLVLLTSAVWFTYLHINQGKTIKLHFNYGKDGERQTDGTDASRKRDTRSSAGHHKSEDTSDSREDEAAVSLSLSLSCNILFCSLTLKLSERCSCLNAYSPHHPHLSD
ncbi:N-acetyl-beta-glucosaminyl-glycoprotein 4-beta-N-acetylgalactosaminyltransferase 1 [Poecilia latipinna]|uniref:N-acetyl-beta-glucosaminyl-glycoprotein 4-beta-N-acetylgalactosaminyltransferase 1 n=1 Tax=Poecilia latipinna TaxID=48699 RepID=UPI00072D9B6E|nr:PREDICTED: N-acetyl-beta-glucosaminyl-glycoprotein 4-beta-N-acetylgalactosaminyltransferase 1-like [Poecilia latipinna]